MMNKVWKPSNSKYYIPSEPLRIYTSRALPLYQSVQSILRQSDSSMPYNSEKISALHLSHLGSHVASRKYFQFQLSFNINKNVKVYAAFFPLRICLPVLSCSALTSRLKKIKIQFDKFTGIQHLLVCVPLSSGWNYIASTYIYIYI